MKKIIVLLVLMLCSTVFAENEIQFIATPGTTNVYCKVIKSNLTVWNGTTYTATPATWQLTAVAMTEQASGATPFLAGVFTANMPASASGLYHIQVWSGAAYTTADTYLGGYDLHWTSTAEISLATLYDILTTLDTATSAATLRQLIQENSFP